MKTSIFNFERTGLLFKRYFTERINTELIYWGIMVIVFMFIRNFTPAIATVVIVAGAFYAARFFREIHSPGNGIAYFMTPATQLEKLTVGIVMTSLYYLFMMIIAYIIGNLAGTFLCNLLAEIDFFKFSDLFSHSPLRWVVFEGMAFEIVSVGNHYYLLSFLKMFFVIQSTFLLGSIYFKNNQAFKTFLTVCLFHLFIVLLLMIEIKLIIINPGIQQFGNEVKLSMSDAFNDALQIFYILLVPFFWTVSYFRLTEKQV